MIRSTALSLRTVFICLAELRYMCVAAEKRFRPAAQRNDAMIKTTSLFVFLSISLSSFGQQNRFDCNNTLEKTPYFMRHRLTEPSDSLQMDFDILQRCGNLDSIDSELLTAPMLGLIMIQHITDEKSLSYKTILKSIELFKQTEDYPKWREAIIASKILAQKTVNSETFEMDGELLLKAGLSHAERDSFGVFIRSNKLEQMTYKEAFALYSAAKELLQAPAPEKIVFRELVDMDSALNTGKLEGKKVLLYFSCYACVNARKMEDIVLTDKQVKSLLDQEFVYFVAHTDDRSKDQISPGTKGEKFIQLQKDRFKTSYQPYFCIIDHQGRVLSEIGNTKSIEEFIAFLRKGLN